MNNRDRAKELLFSAISLIQNQSINIDDLSGALDDIERAKELLNELLEETITEENRDD